MKFKIEQGTETYRKLMELKKRCDAAHAATVAVLDELGVNEYVPPHDTLTGGVVAVAFSKKPDGWRKSDWGKGMYQPKVSNVEWVERLKALPRIPSSELNAIVGFVPQRKGLTRFLRPAVNWDVTPILLSVQEEADYTPPNSDIVEILTSEYQRLSTLKKEAA